VVRIVPVVHGVVFWKRHHRPSLPCHESARVENSSGNENIVVSLVNEPQNEAGGQSSAIGVVARERYQNDDT